MLAVWFIAQGATAEEAIARVRQMRPGSIESSQQEAMLHEYEAHRAKQQASSQ